MGAAAVPMMIAMTAGSMVMQRKAASAEAVAIENDAAMAAEQAKSAANEQTIARKEKLLQAMSSQMAGSGASGAGLSGSTYNIMLTDIGQAEAEQTRSDLGATINASNLRKSAKTNASLARRRGNIAAGQTLISGTNAAYSMGGTGLTKTGVNKTDLT